MSTHPIRWPAAFGGLVLALVLGTTGTGQAATLTAGGISPLPGQAVEIRGEGFSPTTAVDIYFDTTHLTVASTGADGKLSSPARVPQTATPPPDSHWFTAVQRSNGASAQFKVAVRAPWVGAGGVGPAGQRTNPFESTLNIGNVARLQEGTNYFQHTSTGWHGPATSHGWLVAPGPAVRAFQVGSSKLAWTVPSSTVGTPAISGTTVVIATTSGTVQALPLGCRTDGGACTPLWTASMGGAGYGSPTIADGVVYVGSDDQKLYAFPLNCTATCQPLWVSAATGGEIRSTPAVVNGKVYVGSRAGKLVVYPTSCATPCQPSGTAATGGAIDRSSPAVAGGMVFIGADDRKVYGFEARCTGTCSPRFIADVAYPVRSSPAVANGMVYVGDLNLLAFRADCVGFCTPEWRSDVDWTLEATPVVANGVVYAAGALSLEDSGVAAFPASCGTGGAACAPLWTARVAPTYANLVVADGTLYVQESRGLRSFDLARGRAVRRTQRPRPQDLRRPKAAAKRRAAP